jgi:acyl-CoA synthetase (AMP-forming)/AMP-acid ligase II
MDGLMMDFPLTISHLVERVAKLHRSVEIVSRRPDASLTRTTYHITVDRALRLAAALIDGGLRPGDRVASLMWNHSANLEAYLGVPIARGVLLPLNLRMSPSDLAFIVGQAQPRWLLVDDVLLSLYGQFKDEASIPEVLTVPFSGQPVPRGMRDYETWILKSSPGPTAPVSSENEASGLCYTTGTTGRPKGTLYSHRSMVLHSLGFALGFELSQRDAICALVPFYHANGYGLPHVATLLGTKLVLPGPHLDAENLLGLLEQERVTFAAGGPRYWSDMLEALEREPHRWSLQDGLRAAIGGSATPESLIRRLDKFGVRVIQGWGMTEISPVGAVSIPKKHLERLPEDAIYALRARQGVALPFVEIRIRSPNGVEPWGGTAVGEIEVRGPWVARAYFRQDGESDRWTDDGWFRTGDVGLIDPEGYLQITDRISDLVKSGGEWISTIQIESLLVAHPDVLEAAVIARPDPNWGERPHGVVVLRDGSKVSGEELNDFLGDRVPRDWRPDSYSFVPSLPKTSLGKISKRKLREALSAGAQPWAKNRDMPW